DVHPYELELRLINEDRVRLARNPDLWRKERTDHQDATRTHMPRHDGDRLAKQLLRLGIGNRAEEAGHHVEVPSQREVYHVSLMERDRGKPQASEGEHLRVQVQPLIGKVVAQVRYMAPRATGHVEQGVACRAFVLCDEPFEPARLFGVVLPVIDRVIK